jgi:hypothetical protein
MSKGGMGAVSLGQVVTEIMMESVAQTSGIYARVLRLSSTEGASCRACRAERALR